MLYQRPQREKPPRRETSLYIPVKRFLETLGFDVKGEICGCDLVAIRGEEPPLAPARRAPAAARGSRRRRKLQGADHDRLSPAGARLRGFAVRRPAAHLRHQSRHPRRAQDSAAQRLWLVFPRRARDLRSHPGGYGGARALAAGLVYLTADLRAFPPQRESAATRALPHAQKKAPTSGALVKEETPMIRRGEGYLICSRCQCENAIATRDLEHV